MFVRAIALKILLPAIACATTIASHGLASLAPRMHMRRLLSLAIPSPPAPRLLSTRVTRSGRFLSSVNAQAASPSSAASFPRHPKQLTVALQRARTTEEVLTLHARYGRAFNQVNLAACWSRLGRIGRAEPDFEEQLAELRLQTLESVGEWGDHGLSNLVHALAKLRLSGAEWQPLWLAAERTALAQVSSFEAQATSNTAWSYAKARRRAPELFDAIAAAAPARLRAMSPQALSNTAWAYATARHPAPALLEAIAVEAAPRLGEFNTQALSNTAWAYASAGHAAPRLFDALAAEATRRLPDFSPQGVANIAWAFATARHPARPLFDAIAREAPARLSSFREQHLSNLAWSFAIAPTSAVSSAPALFDAIAAAAVPRLGEFTPQGLTNLAWAYAEVAHPAPELYEAIGHRIGSAPERHPTSCLTTVLWAIAAAGGAPRAERLDAVAEALAARLDECADQELCNAAWAFAVFDHVPRSELFGAHFGARCEALSARFSRSGLCQLHQWRIWAAERALHEGMPSPRLLERCHSAFEDGSATASSLQRAVGDGLAALGLRVEEEVQLSSGYSLDFVVDWRGQRLGVEVEIARDFT